MTPLRAELEAMATRIVAEREAYHEMAIPRIDRIFLIDTMTEVMFDMANKFVIGAKEHGGEFINGCDHLMELDNEAIDFIMYSKAYRFRKNNPQLRK